jgi:hypothetical protein
MPFYEELWRHRLDVASSTSIDPNRSPTDVP